MQRSVTKNTKTMYNIREFGWIKLVFSLKMDKMLAFWLPVISLGI